MNSWDVGRIFTIYRQLLAILEPAEAEHWLMREQPLLNGERPCALIDSPEGFIRVMDVVQQLTASVHV